MYLHKKLSITYYVAFLVNIQTVLICQQTHTQVDFDVFSNYFIFKTAFHTFE